MTSEQFCYWMQGFCELSGNTPPTAEQWKSIVEHLQLVFNKKTSIAIGPGTTLPAVPPQINPFEIDKNIYQSWRQDDKIIC